MLTGTHSHLSFFYLFFFIDPATTEIYTLSLHDALPIFEQERSIVARPPTVLGGALVVPAGLLASVDRKSTRLNSSHTVISYAVFCLKKKKYDNKKSDNDRAAKDQGANAWPTSLNTKLYH